MKFVILALMAPNCCFTRRQRGRKRKLLNVLASGTSLALAAAATAQYEDSFFDRIEVTPSVTASLTYDTNVTGQRYEAEDFMIMGQANVGLVQPYRHVRLGVEITAVAAKFLDYGTLDYEDIYLGWIIDTSESAGTRRLRYTVGFDIQEDTGTNDALQGRVRERDYRGNARVSYLLSRQTSIGAGFTYNKRDPRGEVLRYEPAIDDFVEGNPAVGSERFGYSTYIDWEQSRRLSYRLTGTYSKTEFDSDFRADTDTYGANLGVNGQLTAKITGNLSAGLQRRERDGESTSTTPTFTAGLNWAMNERTSARISATKRFEALLDGSDSDRTSISISANRRLSQRMSFFTGLDWTYTDYETVRSDSSDEDDIEFIDRDRKTSRITATAGLSRTVGTWGTARASISWSDYHSDYGTGDYDRFRATLALTAHF